MSAEVVIYIRVRTSITRIDPIMIVSLRHTVHTLELLNAVERSTTWHRIESRTSEMMSVGPLAKTSFAGGIDRHHGWLVGRTRSEFQSVFTASIQIAERRCCSVSGECMDRGVRSSRKVVRGVHCWNGQTCHLMAKGVGGSWNTDDRHVV